MTAWSVCSLVTSCVKYSFILTLYHSHCYWNWMSASCTLSYMTMHHWNDLVLSSFSCRRTYAYSSGIWGCHLPKFQVDHSDFDLDIAISIARMDLQHKAPDVCLEMVPPSGFNQVSRMWVLQIAISLYLWERRQDKDLRLVFETWGG